MTQPSNKGLGDAVAVVGMGCRFPGSPNLPAFWRTVRDSRVWSGPIPRARWNHELFYSEKSGARDHNKTYVNRLCLVEDPGHFAPDAFGISPRRARIMDPQQRLFLDAVRGALEDAGYARRPLARDRVGTYVGATVSDFMDLVTVRMRATLLAGGEFGHGLQPVEAYKAMTQDLVPLQAYTVVGSLLNMAAANVNQCFDFGGPAFTTDAACSSALVALHEAVLHLRHGICDTAIVGGVYMVLSPDNVLGFARIGAVSMANVCRPFDQRADGFVVGEGVGAVVLKRLSEALASNDHIYAVIRGVGINNDGKGEGPMTPRKEGQIAVLDRAYGDAGLDPRTIDFIEAHGTATPVGDATEIAALAEFRGRTAGSDALCALSSVKANVGHSMSAAGIAGFIRAALSVDRKTITPHAAYEQARPDLALEERGFFVPQASRAWDAPAAHPRRAGVNSFGFGGTNVHVVLEEAPSPSTNVRAQVAVPAGAPMQVAREARQEAPTQPQLFVLSAPNVGLLQQHAADLHQALLDDERIEPEALSYTLHLRKSAAARAAFVAETREEVLHHLAALAAQEAVDGSPTPLRFLGEAPADAPKVAFLFPGQGAQVPELARDLYDRFPSFRRTLEELTAGVVVSGRPLLSYLYPRNGARERAMQELTRTEVCQPIMAALGLAVARLLRNFGMQPVAVTGHSLGEFAAAADAGLVPGKTAVDLVAARGRIIAGLPLPDPGTMAAVAADAKTTAAALDGVPDVGVANMNHPRQTVISGTQHAVPVAMERLEQQGIKTRRLNVSHAFHSPLMAGLRDEFTRQLEAVEIAPATTELVSGVTPGPYPTLPAGVHALWAEHATLPVDFMAATRAVANSGARVLVQVGGGSALINMARATLAGVAGVQTLAATGDTPDGTRSLLAALAQLYVAGVELQLEALFEGRPLSPTTLPASVLETRHLWPVKKEEVHPRLRVATTEPPEPLLMSQQNPKDASFTPAPSASGDADARPELAALFRQQMALLDTHAAIIRQQNELLLRGGAPGVATAATLTSSIAASTAAGASLPPARAAASEPAPPVLSAPPVAATEPASARTSSEVSTSEVEAAIIAAAARITASPASSMSAATRLGGDLGFDSLMVVELSTALSEVYSGLELPRSVFAGDLSVAQLARHIVELLSGSAQAATSPAADPASAVMGRHAVVWQAAPLAPATSAPVDDAPVVVVAGSAVSALAQAVAQQLRAAARQVTVVEELPQAKGCEAAHVIDLRPLAPALADDLVAPVLAALTEAQRLDAARPASWRFVRSGLATAGLDGFAKALHQEWEHTTVATLALSGDVALDAVTAPLASAIASEILSASTCPEVRFASSEDGRLTRQIAHTQAIAAPSARPGRGQVVLVSGGAQGLGAKLARSLVVDAGAKVALLGRRPAEDASVAALVAELRGLGGSVFYAACDVRDLQAVTAAVEGATCALGPIEAVVHAAGVAADGPVGSRSAMDAEAVLATKLVGASNLWQACSASPLRAFVALGSLAGRFGNAHQCDYAAANGALPALLARFQTARPGVRTTVLHLPPWSGGGLIDRLPEAARKALASRVRFLRDEEGLPLLLDALAPAGAGGEFVVAASVPAVPGGFAWVRTVNVEDPGYLADHVIASRPVLPLAGAVDWMVEAAQATGHRFPIALRHLTVVDGVVLERANAKLRLALENAPRLAGQPMTAKLSLARVDGRVRTGFRAELGQAPGLAPLPAAEALQPPSLAIASYYQEHTFHGPGLHAITHVEGLAAHTIVGDIAALPVDGGSTVVAGLDGVLQLFGFWSTELHARGGLPLGIKELVVHRLPESHERLRVMAHARAESNGRLWGDADVFDARGGLVMSLRGFEAEPREHGHVSPERRNGQHAKLNGNGHGHGKAGNGTNGHAHTNGHIEAPAIPAAHFRIEEFPEVKDLQQRMGMAQAMGISIPYFRSHEGINAATATINGQTLINFSSYNYLGFSGHPEVTDAAKEALDRYGSSVSASRIASGERPLHTDLEKALAEVIGCEDSIVMVGGHATNVSVLGHLLGPEDLVVHDSLAHDSIVGGVKLSGARRRPFPHNDVEALERILRESRAGVRRVLIAVEGVYSMDGDIAPLDRIIEIKRKYGALLLVDEAHSIGVLGAGGRGVGEHFNVDRSQVDLWMGTLSKSFASCGGYIAGTRALVQYLRYTVPGFVYSVGISPANAAAALAAIRLMQQHPELPAGLREKSRLFLNLCRERGLDTGPSEGSAVIPCIVGNSYICLQLSQALLARGINVQPILYPAVEENQARLRFFISVTHTEEHLRVTADIVAEELYRLKPDAAKPVANAALAPQRAQTQP